MDSIRINNIVVYPKIKPKKEIILKKLNLKDNDIWINIYITTCSNIYYFCSENHPIYIYENKNSLNILSHLYYILQYTSYQLIYNSIEYNIISSFLNNLFEHIRKYSKTAYEESQRDPIVNRLFNEFCLPIYASSFTLSRMKYKIDELKRDKLELKMEVNSIFEKINLEIQKIGNIVVKKSTKDSSSQTSPENYWKNKSLKKDIAVQSELSSKTTISIQTTISGEILSENSVETSNISTQSENILLKNISTQTDPPDNTQKIKKKNKEEDMVTMTTSEYLNMMKEHNEIVKKTMSEGMNDIKNNYLKFFQKNPLDAIQLLKIFINTNQKVIIDTFYIWTMKNAFRNFHAELIINGGKKYEFVAPFARFWTSVIMTNQQRFKNPIFKRLIDEWIDLMTAVIKGWADIKDLAIDIIFTYYMNNFSKKEYEKLTFMPSFFNLLIHSCRNINIFTEIIRMYARNVEDGCFVLENTISDLTLLFTIETPEDILSRNKHLLKEEQENIKAIYQLDV